MSQNQNILQKIVGWFKRTLNGPQWYKACAVILCILVGGGAFFYGLGYAVEKHAINPVQAGQVTDLMLTALANQLNENIQTLNSTLITTWSNSTSDPVFYTTQLPYAYVITDISGYYCLQAGTTGYLQAYTLYLTQCEQWALGNTTAGTICLKQVAWDTALTIPANVLVIQELNADISAQSL